MAPDAESDPKDHKPVSRRSLLVGAGILGGGMIGGAVGYAGRALTEQPTGSTAAQTELVTPGVARTTVPVSVPLGTDTIPFYGERQAGVDTPLPAHAVFIALDLKSGVQAKDLQRMLFLLTDDAARLTQGRGALADLDEELAAAPARLTVTFGFGPEIFDRTAPHMKPAWLKPLPAFEIDQLEDRWSDGDLLLQISGDNPMSVAHARRMLLKDARAFADVRWIQKGFAEARGVHPEGTTMRNLFGQIDGTSNPTRDHALKERVIWGEGDGNGHGKQQLRPWIRGGTSMVIRRIAMNLDEWDELDRPAQEEVIGRKLGSGAPLTGTQEHDEPDFEALGPAGFPVISDISHMRRARTSDPDQTMHRRAFNYDDQNVGSSTETHGHTGVSQSGLIFVAFQCDVDKQYVPIQQRLSDSDHLNLWTTPVGSAVFAIPPGAQKGDFIGHELFT